MALKAADFTKVEKNICALYLILALKIIDWIPLPYRLIKQAVFAHSKYIVQAICMCALQSSLESAS